MFLVNKSDTDGNDIAYMPITINPDICVIWMGSKWYEINIMTRKVNARSWVEWGSFLIELMSTSGHIL